MNLHKPQQITNASIDLPGSKSISNRVLIIKAISNLKFDIENNSNSDDTLHLQNALKYILKNTNHEINIGHAGTDMRFLTAFLSLQKGTWILTGSQRMQQRPITELVDVLKLLGATIEYVDKVGFPPLKITGNKIIGGEISINSSVSSQFISALLLVAPYFTNGLELQLQNNIVSKPYINMTIALMQEFGAAVTWKDNVITVVAKPYTYIKKKFTIESDWSAASYFYSLITLTPLNTVLTLKGLYSNSLQPDAMVVLLFEKLGIKTEFKKNVIIISKIKNESIKNLQLDLINSPDVAQTLVCLLVALNITFKFKGLQTLVIKETNRIVALETEFKKIGINLIITNNSIAYTAILNKQHQLIFNNNTIFKIDTYSDHRMAMAFAPLCVLNNLIINDSDVVTKSFPEFWNELKKVIC